MHHGIAAHRASLLREVEANAAEAATKAQARAAAAYWQALADLYRDRREVYRAPRLGERLAVFRLLQSAKAYAAGAGLGGKFLLKDFFLGVCRLPVEAITPKDHHTATVATPPSPQK